MDNIKTWTGLEDGYKTEQNRTDTLFYQNWQAKKCEHWRLFVDIPYKKTN